MSTTHESSLIDYEDLGATEEFDELAGDELAPEEEGEDEAIEARKAQARAMGWKDRDVYRGPPDKWSDHETFLYRAETETPIMRENNRRMAERLVRLEGEVTRLTAIATRAEKAIRDADKAGYDRAIKELKAKQRQAASEGDTETFDEIETRLEELAASRQKHDDEPEPEAPRDPNEPHPDIKAFVAREAEWFHDPARKHLQTAIIAFHNAIMTEDRATGTQRTVAAQLDDAFDRLKRRYPNDFEAEDPVPDPAPRQRRPALPTAQRPRPATAAAPSSDPFMRIEAAERADARKAFESARRLDEELTPSEYVAVYLNPRLDVRELRAQRKRQAQRK